MERRLAAILAADVVGYSRLMGADEAGTLAALRSLLKETIEPLIARHRGRVVKLMGDGVLAEFASVVDAVECAVAWQVGRAAGPHPSLRFRIGVSMGDVIHEDGDVYGDGVNLAARLESMAETDGICISAIVHDQIERRVSARFSDIGAQRFKNIERAIRVWRWTNDISRVGAAAEARPVLSPPSDRPSIAVLPFDNMSNDPEQAYFADGITEDLITELSRIPALLVIARNSAFAYKGKPVRTADVCRDLGVRFVLGGSVRKAARRVRITAQLTDGGSGGQIWAERYDRELEDVFAVQDDVTQKIVRALAAELVEQPPARTAREPTQSAEAYDCVLRGREQYRLFTHAGNATARALYERAAALDRDYAEPHAGLAETYVQDWLTGSEATLDRALAFAEEALARDDAAPLVQEALSTVYLFMRRQSEAVATARRWTALEPGSADACATLAGALHFSGENEDVPGLIAKAMRLNPHYPFYYPHYAGMADLAMRRFEDAVASLRRAVVRNPEALWPHVFLASSLGHLGRRDEALVEAGEIMRLNPEFSVASLSRLLPYRRDEDYRLLEEGLAQAGIQP